MSSEGNIFPSASDSNFAEVGHRNVCANVRAGKESWYGVQGASEAVGKGKFDVGSPICERDAVGQELVKESLMFLSCAGRAAWFYISEVTVIWQGSYTMSSDQFSQAYAGSVSRVG